MNNNDNTNLRPNGVAPEIQPTRRRNYQLNPHRIAQLPEDIQVLGTRSTSPSHDNFLNNASQQIGQQAPLQPPSLGPQLEVNEDTPPVSAVLSPNGIGIASPLPRPQSPLTPQALQPVLENAPFTPIGLVNGGEPELPDGTPPMAPLTLPPTIHDSH